ncbi:Acidic leucine-rich nuclear phosphoprotein 32 member [Sparganum proliferum]
MSVVPMSQRLELEIKDKQPAELDLSENPIVDGVESLTECPKLEVLNLSGNKLKTVSDLSPLASLANLKSLELNNCEIAAIEDYRKEVFSILPKLQYLDGLDQNGEDEPVTDDASDVVHKPLKDVAPEKNGSHVEEGDEEDDDEEDDEEEEEVGISALQGSKELEDDEEDYVPGAEDEDVDDLDDEDEEDEDDEEEDDEEVDEDEVADLSGSGVTGPRRAVKRPVGETQEPEDAPSAKCKATDEAGDHAVEAVNGSKDDA